MIFSDEYKGDIVRQHCVPDLSVAFAERLHLTHKNSNDSGAKRGSQGIEFTIGCDVFIPAVGIPGEQDTMQ